MELDALNLEETGRTIYFPVQPAPFAVPSVSPKSTIAPASSTTPALSSRPALEPPKNALYNIIDFNLDMEETTSKITNTIGEDLRQTLAENKKIHEERSVAVQKVAKATQSQNTWSTLSYVAGYVLNIGSIMTGSHLLMASGIIGIATRIGKDTHLLDSAAAWMSKSEEMQEKILKGIDGLSIALQTGLALSGAVLGWHAGTFALGATPLTLLQKTSSALTTAGGIASIASQVGISIYQNKIVQLRSEIKKMDGDTAMHMQDDLPRKTKQIIGAAEQVSLETKMAAGIVDLYSI